MLFQCNPFNSNANFVRLDFNPSKVNLAQVKFFINKYISNGFQRLIETGLVTRIDLATNLKYIKPHHLLFHVPQFSVGCCYYKSGNTQSVYLGNSESINQWIIYDKKAEAIQKKSKNPMVDTTRVEFRHRPNKLMVKDLLSIQNPFVDLQLIAYPQTLVKKDTVFRLLLATARLQGMTQALLNIAKQDKPEYISLLKASGKTDWFKPVIIWEGYSKAVHNLVHPYENLLSNG